MLRINEDRFRTHFDALTRIGATDAGGLSRPTFSPSHLGARRCFRDLIEAAGLVCRIDGAGNHSAVLTCNNAEAPTLLLGSHLDSVPDGGRFDGTLGVAAALEVLLTIKDAAILLPIHLEVIDFTDEEGTYIGLLGSRALAGALQPQDLEHPQGKKDAFEAGLRRAGLTKAGILSAARQPETLAGYLELHIEQGRHLEASRIDIGVVTSIVGIAWYHVAFVGRADHAGTTPMEHRLDAAQGASAFTLAAHRVVTEHFPICVANIGEMTFVPGAFNIVPETVTAHLEIRAPESSEGERLEAAIHREAEKAAASFGLKVNLQRLEAIAPAPMDDRVQRALRDSAERLGLSHRSFPSGAGHDAQSLARVCPAGMLFVPSVGGFSHSSREYTKWEDCVHGANTLLHAALTLAT
ncbi:MAG: Zn-dependent hydrolase [Rhodothermales bacterium]